MTSKKELTFHRSPWAQEATGSREWVEGLSERRAGNLPG